MHPCRQTLADPPVWIVITDGLPADTSGDRENRLPVLAAGAASFSESRVFQGERHMHNAHQPVQSTRAVPKARVRTFRNAVTATLLTAFMALPVVATGQSGPADLAGGARPSATSTSAALDLDIDRLVANAMDRGVLLQRTRSRPTANSSNNAMRWAGIGMLALGGVLALNGAISTCGGEIEYSRTGSIRSVKTSRCWTRAAVGGGVAAAGLFMMTR